MDIKDLHTEKKETVSKGQYGNITETIRRELAKIKKGKYLIYSTLTKLLKDEHNLPTSQQAYNRLSNACKTSWFKKEFATEIPGPKGEVLKIKNGDNLRVIVRIEDVPKLKK